MSLLGELLAQERAGQTEAHSLSGDCTTEELEDQLDDLRARLYTLELREPRDRSGGEYAVWSGQYRELEEQIGLLEDQLGG